MKKNCYCEGTPSTDAAVLAKVAAIASPYKGRDDMLIQVLTDVQAVVNNSVPREVAEVIAHEMQIPLTRIYGVVSFYAMFSPNPRGKYVIRMCKSAPCHVQGAAAVMAAFETELGIASGETTADGKFTLENCECLGICDVSPAAMINDQVFTNLTPAKVKEVIAQF